MNRIIVALDNMNKDEIMNLAKKLKGIVWGYKLGHVLKKEGMLLVSTLRKYGNIFVDNKYFDIPETMNSSIEDDLYYSADIISIHCRALYEPSDKQKKHIVGITYLTSEKRDMYHQNHMVDKAIEFGYEYVVCSGVDINILSRNGIKKICPGIRLDKEDSDSHKRRSTPFEAILNGADLLVIGRTITKSKNTIKTVEEINREIDNALRLRAM